MSEQLSNLDIKAITHNYQQLLQARVNDEPVLEQIFEGRMNRVLDEYNTARHLGHIALGGTALEEAA